MKLIHTNTPIFLKVGNEKLGIFGEIKWRSNGPLMPFFPLCDATCMVLCLHKELEIAFSLIWLILTARITWWSNKFIVNLLFCIIFVIKKNDVSKLIKLIGVVVALQISWCLVQIQQRTCMHYCTYGNC